MFKFFKSRKSVKSVTYTRRQLACLAAQYLGTEEYLVEVIAPLEGDGGHYGAKVRVYPARWSDRKANKRQGETVEVIFW